MRVIRFDFGSTVGYGVLHGESVQLWTEAPWLGGVATQEAVPLSEVRLLAPCQPGKIIGIAINFPGATGLEAASEEPLVFLKAGTSVIGPNDTIVSPFVDVPVWGESELAIMIGKQLTQASRDEAVAGTFGYTIGNDVSADNIQGWDHHLARSKSADTFCVLGPWIDTDFDPTGKIIRGYHNQELLRQGNTSDRLLSEPDLLVWLSNWMTLEPGDVILTGAPTRVRERMYLQTGDTYTCAIEGIGELSNSFRCDHKN